jgi:hypothetical protein
MSNQLEFNLFAPVETKKPLALRRLIAGDYESAVCTLPRNLNPVAGLFCFKASRRDQERLWPMFTLLRDQLRWAFIEGLRKEEP